MGTPAPVNRQIDRLTDTDRQMRLKTLISRKLGMWAVKNRSFKRNAKCTCSSRKKRLAVTSSEFTPFNNRITQLIFTSKLVSLSLENKL